VLVGHAATVGGITTQLLTVFDITPQAPYVAERTSAYFPVTLDPSSFHGDSVTTLILKTAISEEGFIYVLQENNHMVVYEAVDYYQSIYLNHKIVKRWEQSFVEL
jgi:hypothetical protein